MDSRSLSFPSTETVQGLRDAVRRALRFSGRPEVRLMDPASAAKTLRAADGRMECLGLEPRPPSSPDDPLHRLCGLLDRADTSPADALTLFAALVRCYEGHEIERGMELVEKALPHPAWRLEAIAAHPHLFRVARERGRSWDSALHILARKGLPSFPSLQETPETLRTLLQALDAIGVESGPDPLQRLPALIAYCSRNIILIEGFLRHHGRDSLDQMRDWRGGTALHEMASEPCHKERQHPVQVLLDLGANPRVQDHEGWWPLDHAVLAKRSEAVRALLMTDAYSTIEIAEVATRTSDALRVIGYSELEPEMAALLRSHQARQVIVSVDGCQVRPL